MPPAARYPYYMARDGDNVSSARDNSSRAWPGWWGCSELGLGSWSEEVNWGAGVRELCREAGKERIIGGLSQGTSPGSWTREAGPAPWSSRGAGPHTRAGELSPGTEPWSRLGELALGMSTWLYKIIYTV